MCLTKKERKRREELFKQGLKYCPRCEKIKGLELFNKNSAVLDGKSIYCKECQYIKSNKPKQPKHTKESCAAKAAEFEWYNDFRRESPSEERFLRRNKLMNECAPHLKRKHNSKTKAECWEKALLYEHRWHFQASEHAIYYQYAHKHGWLDEICSHMTLAKKGGWRKPYFIRVCESKNNEALLYLIKCFGNGESFYKVGITSVDLNFRYPDSSKMPYNYKCVWEMSGIPSLIWDTEKTIKNAN